MYLLDILEIQKEFLNPSNNNPKQYLGSMRSFIRGKTDYARKNEQAKRTACLCHNF